MHILCTCRRVNSWNAVNNETEFGDLFLLKWALALTSKIYFASEDFILKIVENKSKNKEKLSRYVMESNVFFNYRTKKGNFL